MRGAIGTCTPGVRLTGKTQRPVEIRALAGARAFPPLLIVLFHYGEGHHYSGNPWLDLLAALKHVIKK